MDIKKRGLDIWTFKKRGYNIFIKYKDLYTLEKGLGPWQLAPAAAQPVLLPDFRLI